MTLMLYSPCRKVALFNTSISIHQVENRVQDRRIDI